MSSRTRWIVMAISAPIIAFAIVGGFLGKVMARETTYPHLKVFNDVLDLITSSYVDEVNVDKVMNGAMRGLADSLDADSAYLTPDEVKQAEAATMAAGDVGTRADAPVLPARDRRARKFPSRKGGPAHGRLRPHDRRQADARAVGVGRDARAARRARLEGEADDHPRQRSRPARRRARARSAAVDRRHRPHRRAGRRATSASSRSAPKRPTR